MKIKKVQMIVAALLFLFSCAFLGYSKKINVYADEYVGFSKTPEDFEDNTEFKDEYDTFLEAYYTNLIGNMGYNIKGSCGYVALGMLLSYYATYQSDKIIDEKYVCPSEGDSLNMNGRHNSPGIYHDYVNSTMDKWSNEKYYNYMYELANDNFQPSFHSKLITIGHDLGYYGYLSQEQPCGTRYDMVIDILKAYLTEMKLVENIDYTLTTRGSYLFESSDIRYFVKGNIQAGKPVLIGIRHGLDYVNAHYCIAYDYDETEDEIYANFGWLNKDYPEQEYKHQHTKVRNAYTDYFFALTIDFKMPHTHTKNYVVTHADGSKDYYCWDNCDIITYKQKEHNYTDHYDIELSEHTAYCACGASKVELHNYIDHYEKADSEYHYVYCECGEKIDEKHYWLNDPDYSGIGSAVRCKYCLFSKRLKPGEFIPIVIGRHDDEFEES